MTEYISLGSNCSVAYHLTCLGLRTYGYPFDWSKSTLTQLLTALEDNLEEYDTSLEVTKFSHSHPYIEVIMNEKQQIGTYICKNKYGITMSHELLKAEELEKVKVKLQRRKTRFLNLDKCEKHNITFIRVETKIQSTEHYLNKLYKVIKKLVEFTQNKKQLNFIIILHSNNKNAEQYIHNYTTFNHFLKQYKINIKFIFYNTFNPDWTLPQINWDTIFK